MIWQNKIPLVWEILDGVFLVTSAELAAVALIAVF
jgi:hypothetical protein